MHVDVELSNEGVTVYLVEVVGVSQTSSGDAVRRAVAEVLNPARRLVGLEVVNRVADPRDGGAEFRATVRLAYTCDPSGAAGDPGVCGATAAYPTGALPDLRGPGGGRSAGAGRTLVAAG